MSGYTLEPDGLASRYGGEEMSASTCKYNDLTSEFTGLKGELAKIKQVIDSTSSKLNDVESELNDGIATDLADLDGTVSAVKINLTGVSTAVSNLTSKIEQLGSDVTSISQNVTETKSSTYGIESATVENGNSLKELLDKTSEIDAIGQSTSATVALIKTASDSIEDEVDTIKDELEALRNTMTRVDRAVNGTVDEDGNVLAQSLANRVEDLESRYLRTLSDVEAYAKLAAEEKTETLILASTLQDTVSSCEGLVDSIEDLKAYYFNSVEAQIRDAKYGWILKCAMVGIAGLATLSFLWKNLRVEKRESAKERFYD